MSEAVALRAAADALYGEDTPATALEAVARIRVWHDALRALSAMAEARLMAAAWRIQEDIPERAQFDSFVGAHLKGVLAPDRAWLMAETWSVASQHRQIRDFAQAAPAEAMGLVKLFVDSGQMEQLELLNEEDERFAALASASPRKRRRMMRDLLAGAGARQAVPPSAGPVKFPLREVAHGRMLNEQIRIRIDALREAESAVAAAAEDLAEYLPRTSPAHRREILAVADLATGALDGVTGEIHKLEESGP